MHRIVGGDVQGPAITRQVIMVEQTLGERVAPFGGPLSRFVGFLDAADMLVTVPVLAVDQALPVVQNLVRDDVMAGVDVHHVQGVRLGAPPLDEFPGA